MSTNGTSQKAVIKRIGELGAVLIVRCETEDEAVNGIRAVTEGGIRAVEVTFTVPGAPSVIRRVKQAFGDAVLLGAGTVLTAEEAEDAVDAGATYLIAPNTDEKVIGAAKRLGVPIIPGAFTPTEIVRAWDMGADAIKVFPASVGGPAYIRALKAPLPNIPMIPTGGVDERTVGEFFRAGAFAVGAGGALFDRKRLQAKDYAGMTEIAKRFSQALKAARES
ncbi:MAG TPA: bifunctional 4-hydroxy-2-oxoglutarate aldolase/2-dehydro-3-deoxy-phosphogluconate aldolase [Planctomycetota bacterium]|nr:bifunctional 4-hydroxy-2-oxoglutarate aldolase/2-dehydro-3-deoxy-phosphogluconate aldolase [Planctomycetota bacterium]